VPCVRSVGSHCVGQSCARRDLDFGGCRCQAFALTGDAKATDPVCHLSPNHHVVEELAAIREDIPYVYRRGWSLPLDQNV
jgi:pyrroloquinoline quinone biosynthesis protein E